MFVLVCGDVMIRKVYISLIDEPAGAKVNKEFFKEIYVFLICTINLLIEVYVREIFLRIEPAPDLPRFEGPV